MQNIANLINIKGNFNFWHSSRERSNSLKLELTQEVVVLRHGPFALVHLPQTSKWTAPAYTRNLNQYTSLSVSICGKHLCLLARDGRVALNQRCHDATCSFDTESQGADIQQQQFISAPLVESKSLPLTKQGWSATTLLVSPFRMAA